MYYIEIFWINLFHFLLVTQSYLLLFVQQLAIIYNNKLNDTPLTFHFLPPKLITAAGVDKISLFYYKYAEQHYGNQNKLQVVEDYYRVFSVFKTGDGWTSSFTTTPTSQLKKSLVHELLSCIVIFIILALALGE